MNALSPVRRRALFLLTLLAAILLAACLERPAGPRPTATVLIQFDYAIPHRLTWPFVSLILFPKEER